MSLERIVEDSLRGLGLDLVEIERLAGGLLRITIDFPWKGGDDAERFVGVDDCERASRQLQYVLEVEGVDYRRLEVSSPGVDRPLHGARDFERFDGERVELQFHEPVAGAGVVARRKFHGTLRRDGQGGWQLVLEAAATGVRRARAAARDAEVEHVLAFDLDELQSARLAPLLDFKRRGAGSGGPVEESLPGAA